MPHTAPRHRNVHHGAARTPTRTLSVRYQAFVLAASNSMRRSGCFSGRHLILLGFLLAFCVSSLSAQEPPALTLQQAVRIALGKLPPRKAAVAQTRVASAGVR